MLRFLARRLVFLLITAIMIVFFVHLGMNMAANSSSAQPNYDLGSQAVVAWHDATLYLRFLFVGQLGLVEQGSGYIPVTTYLRQVYQNSMGLVAVSLACAAAVGGVLGAMLVLTRLKRVTLPVLTLTILGISTPSFFAALLLQQGEIAYLARTGKRLVSVSGYGWDFDHMLLPLLVLMARPLAYITRAVFMNLRRVMGEDFIRTARSKGLSFLRVVNVHAFRNLAVPVLTALGVSLRFSLGSLPIVEIFFGWPGLGKALLEAVDTRQTALAVTLALALGMTILVTNLVLDICYRLLDPRMRMGHEETT